MSSSTQTAAPPKAVRGMGPAIIVVLIIIAALLGYYQIIYYPSVNNTSTSTVTLPPTTPHLGNITILSGAGTTTSRALTFSPDVATVILGYNSTVVWTNGDLAEHTITANSTADPDFYAWSVSDAPAGYNNILPKGSPGDALNFTFTTTGTFGYYCKYHAIMIGTIIVKAGAANSTGRAASGSSTSSGIASTSASILGGFGYFLCEATVLAKSLATLTGSGIAP